MQGDRDVAGESDISDTLNIGVQVLGGAIGADISEEVRQFDVVVSGDRLSEVVRGEDWVSL